MSNRSKNSSSIFGQVNQKSLGRAASKCWLGKPLVVVVMNRVDHPHVVVRGGCQLVEKNHQPLGIILYLEEEVEKGINIVKI